MKNTIQQGDVLLKRTSDTIFNDKKIIATKKLVLAEGESTGHFHGLMEPNSSIFSANGKTYLEVNDESTLTHQEHGHIAVEPGIWEIGRVQEYDYFSKMVKPVVD